MFCHACGAENDETNRFCRSCGTGLPVPDPKPQGIAPEADAQPEPAAMPAEEASTRPAGKACPSCGTLFPPELRFCDRDGTALIDSAELAVSSPPPPEAPAVEEPEEPVLITPEPEAQPEPEPEQAPEPPAPSAAEETSISPEKSDTSAAPALSAFCESCGFRLEAGDTFCSGCGAKVDAPGDSGDAVAELPTPTDPMPPVAEAGPAPEGNGAQSSPSPDIAEDQPEFGATIAAMPLAEDEVADEAQPAPAEDADPAQADILPETDDDALADETLAAGEQSAWYPDEAPKRKSRAPIWTAGIIAIIAAVGGAGYVYRDQVMAYAAKAGISLGTDTAGGAEGGAEVAIPRVAGKYTAFLMDQDIEIEFEGEPAFLAQSKGTARYLNTVNGGRCVSRLVAIESGGIGGSTDSKVLFSQQPKEGEPPCGQDIPMQIDIDRQAMEKDGRVKRLVIEWQSAETREVLMSGTLEAKE